MSLHTRSLTAPGPLAHPLTRTYHLAAIVGFAALVALGARVSVPLWPVPMSLQVPFVLLAGGFLGARRGAASMACYLAAGLMGAPVFVAGGGPAYLLGPTAGYLVGFVPAAALVGYLAGRQAGLGRLVLAMSAGVAVIHAFGLLHLTLFLGRGLGEAMEAGLLPFLPGDVLKVAAASTLVVAWRGRRGA
jgi:biotin transport system substrate-specific component